MPARIKSLKILAIFSFVLLKGQLPTTVLKIVNNSAVLKSLSDLRYMFLISYITFSILYQRKEDKDLKCFLAMIKILLNRFYRNFSLRSFCFII